MPSSTLLPTPLPANRPMRWPRPTVEQAVDRAHADIQRLRDGLAPQRIDRRAGQPHAGVGLDRTQAVQRTAGAIDDAAEQLRPDAHRAGVRARHHPRIGLEAVQIAGGHQVQPIAGKADHFGFDARADRR